MDSPKEEFSGLGWTGNVCWRRQDSGTSARCHHENLLDALPLIPKQQEPSLGFQDKSLLVDLSKGHSNVGNNLQHPCLGTSFHLRPLEDRLKGQDLLIKKKKIASKLFVFKLLFKRSALLELTLTWNVQNCPRSWLQTHHGIETSSSQLHTPVLIQEPSSRFLMIRETQGCANG